MYLGGVALRDSLKGVEIAPWLSWSAVRTATAWFVGALLLLLVAIVGWALSRGWDRFVRNRAAVVAGAFLIFIGLACLLANPLAPYDYRAQDLALGPVGPSSAHLLGTDILGRDLLSRILHGGAVSILVGLIATVIALVFGTAYGVVAAQVGGRTGDAMMRAVDVIGTLPLTLIIILCTVIFGQDLWLLYLVVGGISWLTMARVVRNEVITLRAMPFVQAAETMGASTPRIVWKHYLPNLAGTLAIYATLTVPGVMLLEAFVSFLGLGVQAPMTSWGMLIKDGADVMEECPWVLLAPATIFASTLLALNFVGDGLRDAFDPRDTRR
jgi:oligopeptide transport system permease protein